MIGYSSLLCRDCGTVLNVQCIFIDSYMDKKYEMSPIVVIRRTYFLISFKNVVVGNSLFGTDAEG